MRWTRFAPAAVLVLALAGCREESVSLDPEAVARGADVWQDCAACHALETEDNRIGPHLVEVVGRAAGAVDGYAYSDAMAGSGLVWDVPTLTRFVLNPLDTVPGTKMALGELSEQEASDVVVYLQSVQE